MLILNLGKTKNQMNWRILYALLWVVSLIGLNACSQDKVTDNDYMPPGIEKPALYKQIREMITGEGGPYLSAKLPNGDELKYFVRWETPIRYYLTGFENHPEYEKYFELKIKEMAELTGLDIARHNDIYRKGFKPLSESPDGMMTNAAFFFSEDMKKTYFDPRVSKLLGAWNDTSEVGYGKWKKMDHKESFYSDIKHGAKMDGNVFMLSIISIQMPANLNLKTSNILLKFVIINRIFDLVKSNTYANYLLSLKNTEAFNHNVLDLTNFDLLFLRELYSKNIKSGHDSYAVVEKMYSKLKNYDFEKGRQE